MLAFLVVMLTAPLLASERTSLGHRIEVILRPRVIERNDLYLFPELCKRLASVSLTDGTNGAVLVTRRRVFSSVATAFCHKRVTDKRYAGCMRVICCGPTRALEFRGIHTLISEFARDAVLKNVFKNSP